MHELSNNNNNTKHPQLQKNRYARSHTFQKLKWSWRRLYWPRLCSVSSYNWSPQSPITAKDTAEAQYPSEWGSALLSSSSYQTHLPALLFYLRRQGFLRAHSLCCCCTYQLLHIAAAASAGGHRAPASAALVWEDTFSTEKGSTAWPPGWQTQAAVACICLHWCSQQQQRSISAGAFLLHNQVLKCQCPLCTVVDPAPARASVILHWFTGKVSHSPLRVIPPTPHKGKEWAERGHCSSHSLLLQVLGVPTEDTWPGLSKLPSYNPGRI